MASVFAGFFLSGELSEESVVRLILASTIAVFLVVLWHSIYMIYGHPYASLDEHIANRLAELQASAVTGQVDRNGFLQEYAMIENDYSSAWVDLKSRRLIGGRTGFILRPLLSREEVREYVQTGVERGPILVPDESEGGIGRILVVAWAILGVISFGVLIWFHDAIPSFQLVLGVACILYILPFGVHMFRLMRRRD